MRHRKRVAKLNKPADQRKAMLRSLTTQLFLHGEVMTTHARAKALEKEASRVITWAKRGDLHSVRLAARKLYREFTGEFVETRNGKFMPQTVLWAVMNEVGPRYANRNGGYVRVLAAPPRRGDNAPMALVQLV